MTCRKATKALRNSGDNYFRPIGINNQFIIITLNYFHFLYQVLFFYAEYKALQCKTTSRMFLPTM